tara:strand:+ start:456 stop:1133 length:678 start_codon:yes stop_codon:yes gene_type:complete
MSEIRVNKLIDEAGTGAVELTQGATIPSGKTLSGAGSISIDGNISIGGTLTYEDVTNIDSIGIVTARTGINVVAGNTSIKGAVEAVNVGSHSGDILTLDTQLGTVFTHDLQGKAVGLVSITNFPASANSFHTVTLLLNQNSAGTANTTAATGIGTNITLTPTGVAGFTTSALVGSATTVTLSTTAEDIDVVTFGIHYNGSGTGTKANYKTFVTKNGDFRYGTIGF